MDVEIDFAICALADYDGDGYLQVQIDSPGVDGSEGTQPAEALFPTGYAARPLDPDKGPDGVIGLGAPCLLIRVGDRRYALPLNDPRDVKDGKVPKLKKGGKMIAGGAGDYRSFFMIDGEDPTGAKKPGSVMLSASYAKGGVKKSLALSFNVRDPGAEDISLVHGDGARVTIGPKGTSVTAPGGKHYIEIGDDGNVLAGSAKVQGSMTVGNQTAAAPTANADALILILTKLCGILAPIVGVSGAGAAAAQLIPELAKIRHQHLKAT